MRVSEYYDLKRRQPELSFVDVDILGDVKLYISPRAVRGLTDDWGAQCTSLIQSFFSHVLNLIINGHHSAAIDLLSLLREPNETHLGESKGESRGRGLGSEKAADVWRTFSESKAVTTGLLVDLEDTVLMIDGISKDIISDVVTNLIRGPLIEFTQQACRQYGIPLTQDVASGPIWDAAQKGFTDRFVELPTPEDEKLLLVPKSIVRLDMDYDVDKYYRHYILEFLREEEIRSGSALVQLIKTGPRKGQPKVLKKDLEEKYGSGKSVVIEKSLQYPHLLEKYREDNKQPSRPLSHAQIAEAEDGDGPNWDVLLDSLRSVPVGRNGAEAYEKAAESIFSALFYPVLTNPVFQNEIHGGRKRIDITYTNMAYEGFFHWLSRHTPSPYIHFECKNYTSDPRNPELDQIAGRFSPNRGQFGIIACRSFVDKVLFARRCKDTARDRRGFIVALDDQDIIELVKQRRTKLDFFDLPMFRQRYAELVN